MANIKWNAFTSGGEMQVGDQTVGLRAGDNRRFSFPGAGVKDADANYLIGWASAGASAVNYLTVTSAISGGSPFILPAGTDADIATLIKSKGNANIVLTPSGSGTIVTSSALILNTSSPSTALQAASKGYVDSVIPSFPISLANGGTNASLVASNGGIFYSGATAGAILSGTATARQVLLSGSSSAPIWSTATYPATTTINQLLYSSSNNVIAGLTTANNGLLVTSNTGVPSILAGSSVTGNMLRSNASTAPSWSTAIFADTYAINTLLYASSSNSITGLATANNSILATDVTGLPGYTTTLPSTVQGNITTVGTLVSGIWNATTIASQYGGTGVNNGASTFTIGGNFALSGAFAFTGTLTGITTVTFPTSGTLATTANIPSLPLSLANGGTAASLVASNGGIVYSGAGAFGVLSGTGTANLPLLSGSNTTPSWGLFALSLGGALTTAGALTTSGAFASTFTMTGITTVTFPTSGTLATTAQIPTGAALTKTDDTNVTLTLGGSPTTALVNAASLTLGWTGQLGLTRGGSAASLTASNGGIVYSTSSALAILSGTATAGQMLQSGASTTPAWSTSTYPSTNAINTLLYASSANVMAALPTANNGVLVTSSGGVPSISSTLPAFTTSSITFNPTTGGIVGTTTNDNAAAGKVGEFISSTVLSGAAVGLTTGSAADVTSISLTAGDWDVEGNVCTSPGSGTTTTQVAGWISTTSATFPTAPNNGALVVSRASIPANAAEYFPVGRIRLSLSGTTTVYLSMLSTFAVNTQGGFGFIGARRVR